MDVESDFKKAVIIVNQNKTKTKSSQYDMLELYGLYKQATEGDNCTECPYMFDYVNRLKWDSWTDNTGLKTYVAMALYVKKVNSMMK
jgi:diazepam-binding inhibitor (GABA receptor modulating acyl-CoA-binding protein)